MLFRFVRVGTLDEPDRWPPDVHIFTQSRQPWVVLPAGVPAFAEYYKSAELWPAASLARRAAVMAGKRNKANTRDGIFHSLLQSAALYFLSESHCRS